MAVVGVDATTADAAAAPEEEDGGDLLLMSLAARKGVRSLARFFS